MKLHDLLYDESGRIGYVVGIDRNGIFARPLNAPDRIPHSNGLHVTRTATFFRKNGLGYEGCFFDSTTETKLYERKYVPILKYERKHAPGGLSL